jgi:hypothetical protein
MASFVVLSVIMLSVLSQYAFLDNFHFTTRKNIQLTSLLWMLKVVKLIVVMLSVFLLVLQLSPVWGVS